MRFVNVVHVSVTVFVEGEIVEERKGERVRGGIVIWVGRKGMGKGREKERGGVEMERVYGGDRVSEEDGEGREGEVYDKRNALRKGSRMGPPPARVKAWNFSFPPSSPLFPLFSLSG